jgi:N-acylneuraminate cytidylyltransferase/CMP-N,N'-diacetyllegionaminic acid synthase
MNILGVIPARGGSKGIPRKNLLTLGTKTLLELAIDSARESLQLTRTIVTTEDPELAEVARSAGAEVPFQRPGKLSTDTASTWSVMQHAVTWLEETEGYHTDILAVLQPTTPFRRGSHIDQTIDAVLEEGIETAITVRETDYPPHWMLTQAEDGSLSRLIDGSAMYTRRQDTPRVMQPNGLVYAVRRRVLEKIPVAVWGHKSRGVVMSFEDSINIDHIWQYRLAQLIWKEPRS